MNNLQILKLTDNFDIWRDIINKAINQVNDMELIPDMSNKTSGYLISNVLNENGEYTLKWVNLVDLLNDLGINTGGGDDTEFPTIGSYLPDGVTIGSTGYTYIKPNGDIENSGNILNHGNLTSEGHIIGNKITSQTSLNGQNLELTSGTPYIDFNYNNTTSDYTSRIIENKSGVLSINGNEFSNSGSSIRSDLRVYTDNNDVIFRNDDNNFSILFSGRNGEPNELRPFIIDISTGLVTLNNGLKTSNLTCSNDASILGNLNVSGKTNITDKLTVENGLEVTGDSHLNDDVYVDGTLYVDTIDVENLKLNLSSLEISPNIHAGAGSSFVSDVYINGTQKSLIIRNDNQNTYLLVSDILNGAENSLRPFSFNMSTGNVTLSHTVNVGNNLNVSGSTTLNTTFVTTLQTYDSSGRKFNIISNGRVYNAVFNDYAEFFEKGEETEVGDIISLDLNSDEEKYIKANNDTCIVGVHSDSYGHILGGLESIEESMKTHIPVGLCGRVKTKIIGSINKGDKVVLSDVPGIGRKYNEEKDSNKRIIGFSVETNSDENIKLVKIKLF